jgi:hypothetical protein
VQRSTWAKSRDTGRPFSLIFARAYTRLEAAAGKGSAWRAKIAHERKTDPLLGYLRQARNVDEHGIEVTERQPGFICEVSSEPVDANRLGAGMISTLEIQDPHMRLVDATDWGVSYPAPAQFGGTANLLAIALLGLSRLEAALVEARTQC